MPQVLAQDLRNAVLQAAIQGRLTEQLSTDQPVCILLDLIKSEKNKLIKDKKIKKGKPLSSISDDEIPFEIPNAWIWVRFGEITSKLTDGSHNPPPNTGKGYPVISAKNLKNGTITFDNVERYVDEAGFEKENPRTDIKNGDIILGIIGGSIGNIGVYQSDKKVIAQRSIAIIDTMINQQYSLILLQSPLLQNNMKLAAAGSAQGGVYLGVISNFCVPIPPIEEQARIVARVDELMAKIDEYEKIEKQLTELKKAFPGNMKDAILQAAMQGKLTEQLKSDDDAYKLCSSISVKDKKWRPIEEDEIPFTIPDNWEWMRLREFSSITAGGTPSRSEPKYWNGDIPWLKIGNMSSKYVTEADEFITEDGLKNSSAKWVKKGTILYSIFASIGTVAILDFEATTNQAIAAVNINERMNRDYMYYVLTALKSVLVGQGHGMAQMNINQEILKNTPIPIPPIKEQQRIVEKLDQLLPLCDSLESMS